VANAKKLTGGAVVAAMAWLAAPGIASAASVNTTHASAVDTTQCIAPLPPGSPTYGDGTPASADRAFLSLPGSTSSTGSQLAFTGGNISKEIMLGLAFIGGGAVVLYRNGRRTLALAGDGTDGTDGTAED
jgi:hypothetical protein